MYNGSTLLRDAAQIYDRNHSLKTHAESIVWWQGFSSGADWMCLALEELRGHPLPKRTATFSWLGFVKYSLASLASLVVLVLAWFVHPALVILVIPAFYAVEVQWVFLFPVVLDGSQNPWTDSRNLMQRHAGTLAAMSLVLPFAWRMLSGGLLGHGFVRSWCTGCLAVVLWYERCRNPVLATSKLEELPKLDIGQRGPLFIREETMSVAVGKSVRLLLITDIHAHSRNCEPLLAKIDAAITMMSPDLIILGGDLADSMKGLALLKKRMCSWGQTAPVLVIPGNHDFWLGENEVRKAVIEAGAHWLPDEPFLHQQEGKDVLCVADLNRWETPPNSVPTIAVLHDPADYPKAKLHRASLALAGHLHGCQVVFAERQGLLLPGSLFYRWNLLRQDTQDGSLIVSRGCADTLPVRWNCPREVVVIDLCA